MVRLENKRSRSYSRQKVDGLNRHEENFHNAVSAWTADAYAMGVSSGKHKGVKQFYKVKKDRRLACNPESCERKKRLANNMREMVCRPVQLLSKSAPQNLVQSKRKELLEDSSTRRNGKVVCMGNQSAEANDGHNEAVQKQRVRSSHLIGSSKDAYIRFI